MPFDAKTEADSFFKAVETEEPTDTDNKLSVVEMNSVRTKFGQELLSVHKRLGDEEYNAFAEKVASDPRLQPQLPILAANAMYVPLQIFNQPPYVHGHLSSKIDTNEDEQITLPELTAAAADRDHFDPISRAGLTFAAKNFDKFRNYHKNDSVQHGFFGSRSFNNEKGISSSDLHTGISQMYRSIELSKLVTGTEIIIEHFATIDANKSGKITRSEGAAWLNQHPEHSTVSVKEALPVSTARDLSGSEALTKVQLEEKLAALKKALVLVGVKKHVYLPPDL